MSEKIEQYNAAFDNICQALAGNEATVTVHMWERKGKNPQTINAPDLESRASEINSLLGVMAKKADGFYTDDWNHPIHPNNHKIKFPTRGQRSHPEHGLLAIATTPLFEGASLYTMGGKTGVLLLGATPVCVSPHDVWSTYFETEEDIPATQAWEHIAKIAAKDESPDSLHSTLLLGTGNAPRNSLVGKLALNRRMPNHPLHSMLLDQVEFTNDGVAFIDPTDPTQIEKAKSAYWQLKREAEQKPEIGLIDHAEVNVNTTLNQAAAIIVANVPRGEEPQPPAFNPSDSITQNLRDNIPLAVSLYKAMHERDILEKAQREAGIEITPTLVVYQPHCKENPLVHVAPTLTLRVLLEETLAQQGVLDRKTSPLTERTH